MKHKYYFSITIDGFTEDKKSVETLKKNLESELWHEHVTVSYPIFREIPSENQEVQKP
ncbi:MAG: hypothetical protein WC998_07950 [Candidatus Paceibacterota bacterium]|jgi:hypothetical protein